MKPIDMLMVTGSVPEARQFMAIGRALEDHGVRVHIAANRRQVYVALAREGWPDLISMDPADVTPSGQVDLHGLMDRYREPTIAEMVASEQVLKDWPSTKRLGMLAALLATYEAYFERHAIKAVLAFPSCAMAGRAAYAVARARGVQTLIACAGPVVTESAILNDIDEGWTWSEFEASYGDEPFFVTENMRCAVDQALQRVAADKARSARAKTPRVLPTAINAIRYLWHRLDGTWDWAERAEVKKEIAWLAGHNLARPRYDAFDSQPPFVFFPLHIPWDAQIATRNPMFASQEALVGMLSTCCPPGCLLYVKEHPYFSGGVNRSLLKFCRTQPNVRVLPAETSSFEIIRHARAVVVVNSTAGLEAIMLKKPLIALGNPYYAKFKYVHRIDNLNRLPSALNEALLEGDAGYRDVDEWYRFFHTAINTAFKSSLVQYKNYMGLGSNYDAAKIGLVAEQIADKVTGRREISGAGGISPGALLHA